MRMFLYARKSSYHGRRKGVGRSVAEQLLAGHEYATVEGHDVAEYVDDGRSASTYARKEREDFERLLADIEAGRGDLVWTWDATRAQRDLAVYVRLRDACREAGVLWHYNGRTYDLSKREDRRASAYDAINAEDQADGISENVTRALRSNARMGRPHGRGLFGYRRVYDQASKDLVAVEIVPEQAAVVREIATALADRKSLNGLAELLNGRGLPSPRGVLWTPQHIRQMILNPAYVGRRAYNGEDVAAAMWPPILDEGLWYTVKAILEDPTRKTVRDTATKHLLSGIASCSVCKAPAWTKPHHSGYRVYWCRDGRHFSCKQGPVDQHVTGLLVARFSRKDAARLFAVRSDDATSKKVQAELARWRSDLVEAEGLVEAGKLSVARLAGLEQRLTPRIRAAEKALESARVNPLLAHLIRPDPEEVFAVWDGLDVEQHRAVVRSVLARLELAPMGTGRRNVDPTEYVTHSWAKMGGRSK